ncbi:CocE/NonD family hydrolase [Sphingomonas sp. GC_Shp_6]|uniref:CocE/NonD family hydrolase n=1 Tax=Sphingomonas sp. GC_Shp_6 TaxID=2937378 RepID=UPI002269B5DD|nr:CocE/NonD family hydrolase [Sphingomonas sp. GC_Shp_6]
MFDRLLAATAPAALMFAALAALAAPAVAQKDPGAPGDEHPAKLKLADDGYGYTRRVVDIPMRDGVKLHTVIALPAHAHDAGMLMTRTPYDAETIATRDPDVYASWSGNPDTADDPITAGGYIRVFQDVRGMHKSQGIYMMNPAPAGTPFNPTKTDDSTDAYDTIAWLVKNVPESNGRVGVIGISYDGFLPLMALVNPHPALKVAVPMNPMVDGWRGDDWFHNGAFRQQMMPYMLSQDGTRDADTPWIAGQADDYDYYLKGGSAGAIGKAQGLDQLGFWNKITQHPAYDRFWQEAAMDKVLAKRPLTVPTMLVAGLWDQEDMYGAPAVYKALIARGTPTSMLYLSVGPWWHGQQARADASQLGAVKWDQNTAKWWRAHVLAPFLAHYLKTDAPAMDVAPVTAFQTGTNQWQTLPAFPAAGAAGVPLYLKPGGALGFDAAAGPAETRDYISDPAAPVGYRARPVKALYATGSTWHQWLTDDQRSVSGRPDMAAFETPVLTAPVTISGAPQVHLTASTSGTDSDWVVKLIDVYPDGKTGGREMAGYQLAVAMDIFRGRYRDDPAVARPLASGVPLKYDFALPNTNHVFLPGHRIMVQVQSSWFPLYDRNPQTFVPNIFFAKPSDYVAATQKITVGGPDESYISLPEVK